MQKKRNIAIPELNSLGSDLINTTTFQRWKSIARPFIGLFVYIIAIYFGLWWISPFIVFLIFVAVVTVTHDIVHGSLGLSRKQSDIALFLLGAILLESGHAYRLSHLQHHKLFPNDEDPEGIPAKMSLIRVICISPGFLFKLYFWALRRTRKGSDQFLWLILEGFWFVFWIIISLLILPYSFAVLWYVIMVIVGSWVYPLLTVYLPHFEYGDQPIFQTRSLRGKIIPALFLELTYHLEHHLYPQVPSHNLKKLSQRLDPFFKEHGAKIWKVF